MDVREMQLPAKDAGKVATTEYARQAAIGKLEELCEQQAQYHESLREQGDTSKSLLQQLLEKWSKCASATAKCRHSVNASIAFICSATVVTTAETTDARA